MGMIRSWGSINNDTAFEVIIDNLMNLELLLWAGTYPGQENSTLVSLAVEHADNTFKYWVRPDGSTFHLGMVPGQACFNGWVVGTRALALSWLCGAQLALHVLVRMIVNNRIAVTSVVFDPETGAVLSRSGTPQGYAVNSTWARGQAWGIYGFTMLYRYTRQPRYLEYAANLTQYWVRAWAA